MIKRDIEIIQGDDYAAADSRALLFTGAGENWPDLAAATFALKIGDVSSEGVLVTASGTRSVVNGLQHITVPLTSAQTNTLAPGVNAYQYDLQATLSGRRLTLAKGLLTVLGDTR
jgi:hypothetical protein